MTTFLWTGDNSISLIYFYFLVVAYVLLFFFFQAEDGIRDKLVTGVQTCALPICLASSPSGNFKSFPSLSYRSVRSGAGGAFFRVSSCEMYDSVTWAARARSRCSRSEEHTSELQSLAYLVCRLLLEKKKIKTTLSY